MFVFFGFVFSFCLIVVLLQKAGKYRVLRVIGDVLRDIADKVEGVTIETREIDESQVPSNILKAAKLAQPVSLVSGPKVCAVFECVLDDGSVTTLEVHELESVIWITEVYLNGFGFKKVAERPSISMHRKVFVDGKCTVCEYFLPL